ncbi:OmpA family protein [Membranihabitans maritimus]|uniref:OmpA family protein n=1 Tax=Membranihabitans maritimus TaxID=2904244 RepID=UPI001F2566FC|nr:OmpA family protein [Membranihabitans maritimus]
MYVSKYIGILTLFLLSMVFSCVTTEKIADGKTAYERKRYAQAIQFFLVEYENARPQEVKSEIAFYLGDSYDHIGYFSDASKWFFKAYEDEYGLQALLKYAESIKKIGNYSEALAAYQILADETQDYNRFQKEIASCRVAQEWLTDAKSKDFLEVENYSALNTPKSDVINSILNSNHIIFSSDRDESEGRNYYAWTGRKFYDLYESLNNTIDPFNEGNINSDQHESDLTIGVNNDLMVFTRCKSENEEYDVYCKIYYIVKDEEGLWTDPVALPFTKPNVNFLHPYLAPNSNTLYFASDIDKDARGYDLFTTTYVNEEWTEPVPLNNGRINSESNELYPTLYKDTLYFSSDRPGMGGLDLYKTYVVNGEYIIPQNMLPPLNSAYDDFKYLPFDSPRNDVLVSAYFNSNRKEGNGSDDIYIFRHILEEEIIPVEEEETEYISKLKIRVVSPKQDDNLGKELLFPIEDVEVTSRLFDGSDTIMQTNLNGEVVMDYQLNSIPAQFIKDGYFRYRDMVSFEQLKKPDTSGNVITYHYRKVMDPIVKNKEIILENIYYDYDRWNIRPDARPVLDSLATLLQNNPDIKIELTSHTDCRGEDDYNIDLSQKRAESAVRFLIDKGVSAERLQPKGYGETNPVVNCICEDCTEDEHQANRRTAFKVLE